MSFASIPVARRRRSMPFSPADARQRGLVASPLAATVLVALCGCHQDAPPAPSLTPAPPIKAAVVDAARLAAREPDQWLSPGGDAMGSYYSPLKDIDGG